MNTLLVAAVFLSIAMGGVAGLQGRERLVRWMGGAACLLLVVYAVGQVQWGEFMVRKRDKRTAVANGCSDADAATSLAEASRLFKAGSYVKAREAFLAAYKAGAEPAIALHGAADCDFNMGNDPQLDQDCVLLLNAPGGKGKARFWRGQMYRRNKDYAKAAHELEMAVREDYPIAIGALAALKKEQGK